MKQEHLIEDVYLVYPYRGTIKVKHGYISVYGNFVPYENTQIYHTKIASSPFEWRWGKVWGIGEGSVGRLKEIIRKHFEDRIREIESSPALAYAEAIAEGR